MLGLAQPTSPAWLARRLAQASRQLEGDRQRVDTGFIVFNDRYYPNFRKLLDRLGVASQPTSMSLSVRCDRNDLEYAGASLNSLFAQRSNIARPAFWRMLQSPYFHRRAAFAVGEGRQISHTTVVVNIIEHSGAQAERGTKD